MDRRALIIGINNTNHTVPLRGCAFDARRIDKVLKRHHDKARNFDTLLLTDPQQKVTKSLFRDHLNKLFNRDAAVALFYFAGHGIINQSGAYLMTSDARQHDEGVSMEEITGLANKSPAREKIILLDCCHSGAIGSSSILGDDKSHLAKGVSIITASQREEPAVENSNGGIFTTLLCDALEGGASDIRGNVTPSSIYTYVDEAMGAWDQRPMFKTNVSRLTYLRKCPPAVDLEILRKIPDYFSDPEAEYPLDPSYEPTAEPPDAEHEKIFGHLQKYRAVNLVKPVGEEHMYYAAMHSKPCRLTPLGRQYWRLAKEGKI